MSSNPFVAVCEVANNAGSPQTLSLVLAILFAVYIAVVLTLGATTILTSSDIFTERLQEQSLGVAGISSSAAGTSMVGETKMSAGVSASGLSMRLRG